jgi:hypothetical protein
MMTAMKNSLFLIGALSACLALCFGGCQKKPAPQNEVENLQELPQDLANTLDPNTMATKAPAVNPAPVEPPDVTFAPCCSSTQTSTMQVNYSYTKCVPRLQLQALSTISVVNPGSGQENGPGNRTVRMFKLTSISTKVLNDFFFCVTSNGPWNATFIEKRECSPLTPQDTLIINALDDQILIQWAGGTPNHPQSVTVVSCREIGTIKTNCGISSCDCSNFSCPSTQTCPCSLQGW